MIAIPKDILQSFGVDTPKIRGFYKHIKSKGYNEEKIKYKICYKEINEMDVFVFIITTSQDHEYTSCFSFNKSDIIDLDKKNSKYLKDVGYINIGKSNELYDFKSKKEFSEIYLQNEIKKIGYFSNKKFEKLKELLKNNPKAKSNYNDTYKNLIPNLGDSFISKYGI